MTSPDSKAILDGLAQHGIDPRVAPTLDELVTLFETWNRSINLSAARTRDAIAEHVVDSLAVVPHLLGVGHPTPIRVLDVGSGGGFPVLIAAACVPTAQFVSLEPVHKKHAFLRTAARTLSLTNLEAFAQRLEDHTGSDYDVAMSRATFELGVWLELGATKVRAGGLVLGFEANHVELAFPVERFPYQFLDRTRTIIKRTLPE